MGIKVNMYNMFSIDWVDKAILENVINMNTINIKNQEAVKVKVWNLLNQPQF